MSYASRSLPFSLGLYKCNHPAFVYSTSAPVSFNYLTCHDVSLNAKFCSAMAMFVSLNAKSRECLKENMNIAITLQN